LEEVEVWKAAIPEMTKQHIPLRDGEGLMGCQPVFKQKHITDRCDTSRKVNHLRRDKYLVFVRPPFWTLHSYQGGFAGPRRG
jgi:hypothetical protein